MPKQKETDDMVLVSLRLPKELYHKVIFTKLNKGQTIPGEIRHILWDHFKDHPVNEQKFEAYLISKGLIKKEKDDIFN